MVTNKQLLEEGHVVQNYPIDQNPFTGQFESNGGVENLVIYGDKVYSVLTDFTGSVPNPNEEPILVTDDAQTFMQEMFLIDDEEEMLMAEADHRIQQDDEEWSQSTQEDFYSRDDDW